MLRSPRDIALLLSAALVMAGLGFLTFDQYLAGAFDVVAGVILFIAPGFWEEDERTYARRIMTDRIKRP